MVIPEVPPKLNLSTTIWPTMVPAPEFPPRLSVVLKALVVLQSNTWPFQHGGGISNLVPPRLPQKSRLESVERRIGIQRHVDVGSPAHTHSIGNDVAQYVTVRSRTALKVKVCVECTGGCATNARAGRRRVALVEVDGAGKQKATTCPPILRRRRCFDPQKTVCRDTVLAGHRRSRCRVQAKRCR